MGFLKISWSILEGPSSKVPAMELDSNGALGHAAQGPMFLRYLRMGIPQCP